MKINLMACFAMILLLMPVASAAVEDDINELWTEIYDIRNILDQIDIEFEAIKADMTEAYTNLQNQLNNEVTERIANDTILQSNITAEETARIAADMNLQNQLPQLGDWEGSYFIPSSRYTAVTDGFVVCYIKHDGKKDKETMYVEGYTSTHPTNPELHLVIADCIESTNGMQYASFTMPVQKDDFWKVETNAADVDIRWIPLTAPTP